jgi:hypothetical protein
VNEKIFGVAKMQQRNADPTKSDVVFAFVNITLDADQETKNGEWFGVDIDADGDGVNDFGIKPDHKYNVKNIAAFTAVDPQRRGAWLWGNARMGSDLLKNGLFVHLNRVPIDSSTWATAPYEPQYLKLYDVTEGVR